MLNLYLLLQSLETDKRQSYYQERQRVLFPMIANKILTCNSSISLWHSLLYSLHIYFLEYQQRNNKRRNVEEMGF